MEISVVAMRPGFRALTSICRTCASTSQTLLSNRQWWIAAWVIDLAKQAAPPLFLLELVRLGLSQEPQFPHCGERMTE